MNKGDTDLESGDPGPAEVRRMPYLDYHFTNFNEAKKHDNIHYFHLNQYFLFRKPQMTESW